MPDEYYERYNKMPHDELYRQLQAGSPQQVDAVADRWKVAEEAIGAVAATLRKETERLLIRWNSPGSREFQYRLSLVVAYAQKLSDEASAMRGGLSVMGHSLKKAQRTAEPATTAPPEYQVGIVDPALGHQMAAEEAAKARDRIAALVATLAAEYAVADHGQWPAGMPEAPVDLPLTEKLLDPAGLTGGAPVEAAALPGDTPGTELAGAGSLGAGHAPSGSLASVGHTAPPAPPATLAGAGLGFVGPGRPTVDPRGESTSARPASMTGGAPAAGMPMAAAAGGHRVSDGYLINDPRLADDGTDWSTREHLGWDPDADAPPSVLGGT
ncbi:hypothetical protein [Virgisporangium aliadipatigenens]|nr:hypothetical protein [Virgisporangium aliadipatigenens]